MDKWGFTYLIEWKTLWEKKKLLVTRNFFFSLNVFKSCLLRENEYLWSIGLGQFFFSAYWYWFRMNWGKFAIGKKYAHVFGAGLCCHIWLVHLWRHYLQVLQPLFEPWWQSYILFKSYVPQDITPSVFFPKILLVLKILITWTVSSAGACVAQW